MNLRPYKKYVLPAVGLSLLGVLILGGAGKAKASPQPNPLPGPSPLPPLPFPPGPNPPQPGPQPGPVPNPQIAAILLAQMQALLTQAQNAPDTVQPEQFDALAAALDANGMTAQAEDMRRLAAAIRAQRQNVPTGGGAAGSKLPDALVDRMTFVLSPSNVDPALIDALVGKIKTDFPNQFLVQVALLEYRAKELRAGSGPAGGVSNSDDMKALVSRAQEAGAL